MTMIDHAPSLQDSGEKTPPATGTAVGRVSLTEVNLEDLIGSSQNVSDNPSEKLDPQQTTAIGVGAAAVESYATLSSDDTDSVPDETPSLVDPALDPSHGNAPLLEQLAMQEHRAALGQDRSTPYPDGSVRQPRMRDTDYMMIGEKFQRPSKKTSEIFPLAPASSPQTSFLPRTPHWASDAPVVNHERPY